MNLSKLNNIWRNITSQNSLILSPKVLQHCALVQKSTGGKTSSSSSSSSSDSDDSNSKAKSDPKLKNEQAITKLNSLLQDLLKNDEVAKKSDLKLAKPTSKRISKEEREAKKVLSMEKKLVKAATDVAQDLGGDIIQTESELLSKLLGSSESTGTSKSLSDIVKGMKIDRETKPVEKTKAEQIRNILQNMQKKQTGQPSREPKIRRPRENRPRDDIVIRKIDLFGAEQLGIFTNKDLKEVHLNTWQNLYERDLKNAVTHPPANYFQQMILWTEQGKLWKFPIDNEQDLDEEKNVYFAKHVFLEEHLEPWCPQKGPLRHFMELVCVGLSKNPYLTVEAKIEHIEWYKNYFEEKRKLLEEVGALPLLIKDSTKQKQIK